MRKGCKTGKKNKCINSLLEICLKAQTKESSGSGWENVIQKYQVRPWYALHKNKQPEQTIKYVKYHIDKSVDSPFCRMFGEKGATIIGTQK